MVALFSMFPGRAIWLVFMPLLALAILPLTASPGREAGATPIVSITVDNTKSHQVMEGFGATHVSLEDRLSPEVRQRAIEDIYGRVRLNTGDVEVGVWEAPAKHKEAWGRTANDDDDPFHFNWEGFNFRASDAAWSNLVELARPLGFTDFYPGFKINVRWANPWLGGIRKRDYKRYLDECGEQVAAGMIHWREAYGVVPRYVQLFNEPTSGNHELDPGSTQEVVDLIKHVGERLRKEGFAAVKFVVPGEETVAKSLAVATAILADPEARQYVGAIAYHCYPYGSTYSSVQEILRTSGKGSPERNEILLRNQLRDLGKRYGLPLWMTEISHGGVSALSFEGFLARAIHIHDELVYADASAYFGMLNMVGAWSHNAPADPFQEEGSIVVIAGKKVFITAMGGAIGHYARWISRGAVRIEAESSDPLVQVTAFRDDARKRLVLVLINNAAQDVTLDVEVKGFTNAGPLRLEGESSTTRAQWAQLPPFVSQTPARFRLPLAARSVTTIAAGR